MKRLLLVPRWLLGYEGVPLMARPTFRYELISVFFASVGAGLLLPQFTQLFARKSLLAAGWILAMLQAGAAGGNFFGVLIGTVLQRYRKVPCAVAAHLAIAGVMILIALLPLSSTSAIPYAVLLTFPAFLAAVVLNVRSGVWHSNFPEADRGRILSRLIIVAVATTAVTVRLAGAALDKWAGAHHILYPLGAVGMVLSAYVFSRIRLRRERSMLRRNNEARSGIFSGWAVLRDDVAYGRFMFWQMLLGSAVLMSRPIVILALTDYLNVSYGAGTTAVVLVPFGVLLLAIPLSGRLFDSIGIMRFRAAGAFLWGLSHLLLFAFLIVAVRSGYWGWVLIAFAVQGLGSALGGIASNIGHTRFARPDQGQLYMGIHMTLQGIRGLTMPFVGLWLYCQPGIGILLIPIAGVIQLVAALGFILTPSRPRVASAD